MTPVESANLIDDLRACLSEAYQMAGVVGAPARVLDNLSAASQGKPLPHKTFLPLALRIDDQCGGAS